MKVVECEEVFFTVRKKNKYRFKEFISSGAFLKIIK